MFWIKYNNVFQDELGMVKGVTAKIHIDPDATPKFHRARSVPFALCGKVEEELKRLQWAGIIEVYNSQIGPLPLCPCQRKMGVCAYYKRPL